MRNLNILFQFLMGCFCLKAFSQNLHSSQNCPVPTGLKTTLVSDNSVQVDWDSIPSSTFLVHFKQVDALLSDSLFSPTNQIQIQPLQSQKTYLIQVATLCSTTKSGFSDVLSFTTTARNQLDTLVSKSSNWKYLDNGSNQDSLWRKPIFNDGLWSSGFAALGYGNGGEATVVGFGPDMGNKYITTYFRKKFSVPSMAGIFSIDLNLLRDDGAVVYLNGSEVLRSNMPAGKIGFRTKASLGIGGLAESNWETFVLPNNLFQSGENQLAVEIHQVDSASSDIAFNLELIGHKTDPTLALRSAYLQSVSPTSVVVRWQTNKACQSKIRYGASMAYGSEALQSSLVKDHEIQLTGLEPDKIYFYTFGSDSVDFGGGIDFFFKTALPAGSEKPFRVWATGDFGVNGPGQWATRDAMEVYCRKLRPDFWVWMGDNAYDKGLETEYTQNVFDVYSSQMKNIPFFPCLGNHDYANVGYLSAQALGVNFPYFNMFSCPSQGECGGVPSQSEKYYSFNYGNAHFVVLDSYGSQNVPGSSMYNWLKNDLDDNQQKFTIAVFHHPPYTMGTHNSDNSAEDINMRTQIVPLLESRNVDLVLNGHSHTYERSMLVKGHFGLENELVDSMLIDTSAGNVPYYFNNHETGKSGTVYLVCGVSGQGGPVSVQPSWPHALMKRYSKTLFGSILLDFNHDTLVARFVASTTQVMDSFKIVKSAVITSIRNAKASSIFHSIETFPNPFSDQFLLRFFLDQTSVLRLRMLDLMGKVLLDTHFEHKIFEEGSQEIVVHTPKQKHANSFRILEISDQNGVVTRKTLIQN